MSKISKKEEMLQFSPTVVLNDRYGITVDDRTFCVLPFMHFSTTTNGEIRPCCRSKKIWNINESALNKTHPGHATKTGSYSLKDLWIGPEYNSLRSDLINGVRNEKCSACWRLEDKGIVSLRQDFNSLRLSEYAHLVDHWITHKTAAWEIPVVELKLSNLCNLKCKMCWPKDSTPWVKQWPTVEHFFSNSEREYINTIIDANNMYRSPLLNLFESNEGFMADLAEILQGVELLEFAGGEPLLDPLHYKILELIPDPSKVSLKYSTNLTDLSPKKGKNVLDIWKKFKSIKLMISIDGDAALNSSIRIGSNWADIKENIVQTKLALGDKLERIVASTCISALNIEHLLETAESIETELGIDWYTSRLQYPAFLHGNVLPIERLIIAKNKLTEKLKTESSNKKSRHVEDAILWIEECIQHNKSDEFYQKFIDYNNMLTCNASP